MRPLFMALMLPAALTIFAVAPDAAWPAEFQTGVAVVDITPPLGYRLSGYFHERLATGTHDPLKAKALVLKQGDCLGAIVLCDIIGVSLDVSTRARQLAEKKTGIPAANILIAATHTHTGPQYFGAMRKQLHDKAVAKEGHDPQEKIDYPATLVEKLAGAIAAAQAAARPVEMQLGVGEQKTISFNRRFHMKGQSEVRCNPGIMNPKVDRAAGPIDPEVGVVLFRTAADRRPLASLTVFALHLDTFGGTEFSADFPYYLEQSLREELGQGFVSLFGNGTCGDINHIDVVKRYWPTGRPKTDQIGNTLGKTVRAELKKLRPVDGPSLAVGREIVDVPLQKFSKEETARAKASMDKATSRGPCPDRVKIYKIAALALRGGDTIPIEVQAFRLGKELAVVGLPGEVFVDLGLAIKRGSPFATTLVIELANDAPGYIPTRKAFQEGSYETVNSRIQPGGGEAMVAAAIRLLKELKQ